MQVQSIIHPEVVINDSELSLSDEEGDAKVDNMVILISENFQFDKKMFTGGLTSTDLDRMRREKKEAKEKKDKENIQEGGVDISKIADLVSCKIKDDLGAMVDLKFLKDAYSETEGKFDSTVKAAAKTIQEAVISAVLDFLGKTTTIVVAAHASVDKRPSDGRTSQDSAQGDPANGHGASANPVDNIIRGVVDSVIPKINQVSGVRNQDPNVNIANVDTAHASRSVSVVGDSGFNQETEEVVAEGGTSHPLDGAAGAVCAVVYTGSKPED